MSQLYISLSITSSSFKMETILCNQPANISLPLDDVLPPFLQWRVSYKPQGWSIIGTQNVFTLGPFWGVYPHISLLHCFVKIFLFCFIQHLNQCRIFSQLFPLLKEYHQIYILKSHKTRQSIFSPFSLLLFSSSILMACNVFLTQLDFVESWQNIFLLYLNLFSCE